MFFHVVYKWIFNLNMLKRIDYYPEDNYFADDYCSVTHFNEKLTAVIIDDHPIVAIALEALLKEHGITVTSSFSKVDEALSSILKNKPNIVIIDIETPDLNGIKIIESIRKFGLDTILIVFSDLSYLQYGKKCATAGANGFVSKKKQEKTLFRPLKLQGMAIATSLSYFHKIQ